MSASGCHSGRLRGWILLAAVAGALAPMPAGAGTDAILRETALKAFGVLEGVPPERLERPDVRLGQALFWDARVSADGRTACASCHLPADWGADRRRFSPDARGRTTSRNSQTVFNAAGQPFLRWTGDRTSAAHQAERSLTGSMGFDSAGDVVPLLRELGYEAAFRAAFPGDPAPMSPAGYGRVLQAYQETLVTPGPFDRFLEGEDAALDARQKAGMATFLEVGCADCHSGPLLGGRSLRRFGIARDYWLATGSERRDAGLFEATGEERDRNRFRVSMLRNIARTAPYFHDGSVAGLEEAVQVMAEVQLGERLPDGAAADMVAFLEALTGAVPGNYRPPDPTGSDPGP